MKKLRIVFITVLIVLGIIVSVISGFSLTDDNKFFGDLDGDDIITATATAKSRRLSRYLIIPLIMAVTN